MEEWLQQYGAIAVYLIVFVGSFVEGESIILLASALAYKYEQISLTTLIILAFLGSLGADQLLYFIGRHYGPRIIENNEKLKKASERVFYHLHKHSTLFILSFRFIYGIRVASSMIVGAAGVPVRKFAILNVIAAAIWATVSCLAGYTIGYFFADSIAEFISNIGKYQERVVIAAVILAAIVGIIIYFKRRRQD